MTANPNNCAACEHKRNPDGGHCYMFKTAPTEICMKHTTRERTIRTHRERDQAAAIEQQWEAQGDL